MAPWDSRRGVLRTVGAVAVAAVAGCSSAPSDDTPTDGSTATGAPSTPDDPTATERTDGTPTETAPRAAFEFDYVDDSNLLLVTHAGGNRLQAGRLELSNGEEAVTWAAASNLDESQRVEAGDITQLGPGNAYPVEREDTVTVSYTDGDSRRELARWTGSESAGADT